MILPDSVFRLIVLGALVAMIPAQALGQDTLAVEEDTLVQYEAAGALDNVRYVRGGQSAAPPGIGRVRQRIRQIRGEPQSQPAAPVQPIIIVAPSQEESATDGTAVMRPRTILVPGAGGVYYPLGGLGPYSLYNDDVSYELQLQERPSITDEPSDLLDEPSDTPDQPTDTLSDVEAERELPPVLDLFPGALPRPEIEDIPVQEDVPIISTEPTVREVERAILDTGLFRGLGVNFEFDQSHLLPEASHTLDAVGDVLQRYEDLRLEVAGHTDNAGSSDYNLKLSERRAEAVVDYLVEHFGISRDRLDARGYGEEEPFTSNASPAGRALNRRVEFRMLNEDGVIQRPLDEQSAREEERLRELLREVVRQELDRRQNQDDG